MRGPVCVRVRLDAQVWISLGDCHAALAHLTVVVHGVAVVAWSVPAECAVTYTTVALADKGVSLTGTQPRVIQPV